MTITVHFEEIVNAISELTFPNINTRSINNLPEDIERLCPLFCPKPDNFISRLVFRRVSYGGDSTAKMDLEYDLTWNYYHIPLADNINWLSSYGDMIANLANIIETLCANSFGGGAVDISVQDIPVIAVLRDAVGKEYHGVEIVLHIREFLQ